MVFGAIRKLIDNMDRIDHEDLFDVDLNANDAEHLQDHGGLLQKQDGVGWGATLRSGKLNEDGAGSSSVSDNTVADYFSLDLFNSRQYPLHDFSVMTSLGWESVEPIGASKDKGLSGFLSLTRVF